MKIWDVIDKDLYGRMLEEKYIRVQRHPSLPLCIVNYTEQAQYKQMWNEVTLNCRGLIWNFYTEEIVARGFPKFFNWDDSSQPYPPAGPVLRMPKMDGSLGILYWVGDIANQWQVATRGSFASDQAQRATNMLYTLDADKNVSLADLNPSYTYLCEIIYPENRIVVDYGTEERLVLLDVLDTASGRSLTNEFDRVYWLDKVERVYMPQGFSDAFTHDIPEGEEGFVIYWPGRNYRVKMKAAEYLALHRMIFSLSERSVWQRLGDGEQLDNIATQLPDEFHGWVREVGNRLIKERNRVVSEVRKEYNKIAKGMRIDETRKEFAKRAVQSPNRAYLFMLYDGNPIEDAVWKTLKPEGGKGVTTISEDVA